MAFDDYTWFEGAYHPLLTPKLAIDEFLRAVHSYLEILTIGHQVWVRKI
jgi:hypothetical protein